VVDGAPQVHSFPGDPDHHFVEVPLRARAGAALPQLARDQRAKFQHPAPHRFIGDVKPTLGQQFLDVSVAQGEAVLNLASRLGWSYGRVTDDGIIPPYYVP
jgi:hypothetical protein